MLVHRLEIGQGMLRGAVRGLAAVAAAALVAVSVGSAHGQDVSGIYWTTQYNAKVQIVGGGELPLTPAGKAAYDKTMAGLKDGTIIDQARITCVPDGPVRN